MAWLEKNEIHEAYEAATREADIWRADYPELERLMNNGLMEDLDENLPEVNDGSLAAALFKLPKRVVPANLKGRAKALDAEDAWITELANIEWENEIVPNANSQAPFIRKVKDSVRKAAGYGGQPIIDLYLTRGNYTGADFIIPQATDVKLEAGKVSDMDSDIIFWDVYYTKLQVKNMIEQAEKEQKEGTGDNKWDIDLLKEILTANPEVDRPGNEEHSERNDKGTKKNGIHFYIAFQRGVDAPFTMCHKSHKDKYVREWSNPNPTGDVPVHYLYCYQDFINPYGIGIVKLAGGTQNVLDYMRQADVLATQLGLRPPKMVKDPAGDVDWDSLVYAEDANWDLGSGEVERMELSNGVYQELPNRINMYKSSLNNILPMGDTSVSAEAGDPLQSKTPAGVKMAAANLSIDDEDFKDNLFDTYAMVFKSMINTHFANMEGVDLRKLNDEQRDILAKSGINFPEGEDGVLSNELEVIWDEARATFDFEIDPEADKTTDEQQQLDGLTKVADMLANPSTQALIQKAQMGQPIMLGSKKIDLGELMGEIIALSTDNDKIITDVSPEDEAMMQPPAVDPVTGQPVVDPSMAAEQPVDPSTQAIEGEVMPPEEVDPEAEEFSVNIEAIMAEHQVPENIAAAMLEAERDGLPDEDIMALKEQLLADMAGAGL